MDPAVKGFPPRGWKTICKLTYCCKVAYQVTYMAKGNLRFLRPLFSKGQRDPWDYALQLDTVCKRGSLTHMQSGHFQFVTDTTFRPKVSRTQGSRTYFHAFPTFIMLLGIFFSLYNDLLT